MTGNLANEPYVVSDGNDSIVIIKDLADVAGGRTLNCAGFSGVIKAGHIIVKDNASGDYEPLAVAEGAYTTNTEGKTFVGVLKATISVERPFAAITTIGQVNAVASPYEVTSAIKQGLPRIEFI